VELGEGVQGMCVLVEKTEPKAEKAAAAAKPAVDLNALSSLLASRWKGGGAEFAAPEPGQTAKPQAVKVGQVRTFRITRIDAEKKRIDLDLA
jgi:small subunit ribosomal protein S1